jgi:hypothetical protein
MFALLVGLAAIVTCVPFVAIVMVSVAVKREESAWSLNGPAAGSGQAAARRLLDFHSEGAWPLPRSRSQVPAMAARAREGSVAERKAARPGQAKVSARPVRHDNVIPLERKLAAVTAASDEALAPAAISRRISPRWSDGAVA